MQAVSYCGTHLISQYPGRGGAHEDGKGEKGADPRYLGLGLMKKLMSAVVVLEDAPGIDKADRGEEGKEGTDAAKDCSWAK